MKNLIIILSVLFFLSCCQSNKQFEITGKINNSDGELIYLDEIKAESLETIDSTFIDKNGNFFFRGKLTIPKFYIIKTDQSNYLILLVNPGEKISIEANIEDLGNTYILEGSEDSKIIQEYNIKLLENRNKLKELNKIFNDSINSQNIESIMIDLDIRSEVIVEDLRNYTIRFIEQHRHSLASLMALYQEITPRNNILDYRKDFQYFEMVDSSLFNLYPDSEPVQALHSQVANLKLKFKKESLIAFGAVPPEIALPDTNGNIITLSSTRGKIVLLDFWAAWCNPCRIENPNLVSNYTKYKEKGFEIYQVSLDKKRENWITAIQEDHLERWIHVSDLKFWNSAVIQPYQLEKIPTNFLLDREGKIIDKDIRGEALSEKLSEIFD
jgi:peroxiredoxin